MKITLIHGEDIIRSRERFGTIISAIKKRGWEVSRTPLNPGESLAGFVRTGFLFASESLFVIDDIKKIKKKDLDWLHKNHAAFDVNLLIYANGEASRAFIGGLPKNSRIESFDLPRELFLFLESLFPGNSANALKLFHSLLKENSAAFIFTMMARQFRDMYWVSKDSNSIGYPAWRIAKLKSQVAKFKPGQIEKTLEDFSEIDIKNKTSNFLLEDLLDLVILTELE